MRPTRERSISIEGLLGLKCMVVNGNKNMANDYDLRKYLDQNSFKNDAVSVLTLFFSVVDAVFVCI
jgi:hypothetical protein